MHVRRRTIGGMRRLSGGFAVGQQRRWLLWLLVIAVVLVGSFEFGELGLLGGMIVGGVVLSRRPNPS